MSVSLKRRRLLQGLAAVPLPLAVPAVLRAQTVTPYLNPALPYQSAMSFWDEFTGASNSDGTGLDRSKWTNAIWYETPSGPVNYVVENSLLKVWPQPDARGRFINRTFDTDPYNLNHASGYSGFQQLYGFFEMRAKLPRGVGPWPAFWIFNHFDDASGSRRPEIDIMEAYPGSKTTAYANTRTHEALRYAGTVWSPTGTQLGSKFMPAVLPAQPLDQAFNVYGVWWDWNRVEFYFNGKLEYTVPTLTSSGGAIFTEPLYVLLDLWFGSGSGRPSTNINMTPTGPGNAYEIDYVRVWPRQPL